MMWLGRVLAWLRGGPPPREMARNAWNYRRSVERIPKLMDLEEQLGARGQTPYVRRELRKVRRELYARLDLVREMEERNPNMPEIMARLGGGS